MTYMKVSTLTHKVKADVNINISRLQAYRTNKKTEIQLMENMKPNTTNFGTIVGK